MRATKRTHGTPTCYARGCRQARCRAAWATYIRERRYRLGEQRPRSEARFFAGPFESVSPPKLTALGKRLLEAEAERTGQPKSDIIEQLLRAHAGTVVFTSSASQ